MRPASTACPECGAIGEVVPAVTLDSLLRPEARELLEVTTYRFCSSPRCSLVYYPEHGSKTFAEPDLVVPVGLKGGPGPRPICYCFGHTLEELRREVATTGTSRIPRVIAARMEDGCECETSNPRGRCCLGTVQTLLQEERGARPRVGAPAEHPSCCTSPESKPPR